jgi:class 3 adenylate cyclase
LADEHIGAGVRAFLIADVRGYTSFTQERGDVEAARLARRFAALVRECVGEAGGRVIELRGDEALCVFDSSVPTSWGQRRHMAATGSPTGGACVVRRSLCAHEKLSYTHLIGG